MCYLTKLLEVIVVIISIIYIRECTKNFTEIDKKFHLASESYKMAKNLFHQGHSNYGSLKVKSLRSIDTFLDLVNIMNHEMAREIRSAVVKFYQIKYFYDFTNYVISMEEIMDITEHCLSDPIAKLEEIRLHFHGIIKNFEDVRTLDTVDKCLNELPDEVAASHCILHQAVLFNETMQESLVQIVEIKTRQHAQDMNESLYNVQACLHDFVPNFFDQLLVDAYTDRCGYLKVVNASISDLINDKWRSNETLFPKKWSPLVNILKDKLNSPTAVLQEPLFITLFAANLSSDDIVQTLY